MSMRMESSQIQAKKSAIRWACSVRNRAGSTEPVRAPRISLLHITWINETRSSPTVRTTTREGRRHTPAPRMSAVYSAPAAAPAGAGAAALASFSAYSTNARELLRTASILLADPPRSPEPRQSRGYESHAAHSAQTRAGSIIDQTEQALPRGWG